MRKTQILSFISFFIFSSAVQAASVKVRHEQPEGKPGKVTAEGTMQGSPAAIWEYLIQFNNYSHFMPRVADSFFISSEGVEALRRIQDQNSGKAKEVARLYKKEAPRQEGKVWNGFVFMVINTPFPVENRWYVLDTKQDESQASLSHYQRCWSLVMGNIDAAQGCWTLDPSDGGNATIGRYEDNVQPGGSVPKWMAKMGATQTVPQMFIGLEKMVLKNRIAQK